MIDDSDDDDAFLGARSTDPETSHLAAQGAKGKRKEIMRKIQACLADRPDISTLEISDLIDVPRVSVSPMLRPMERKGLVIRTKKASRYKTGALQDVWRNV